MAQRDNLPTILAIGVVAYVSETLGHELLGHGGMCLLQGGRITALAPLWMRCSISTLPMVIAGPAFNLLAGGLCAAVLSPRRRSDTLGYALWLTCAFNLLVACGYLIVGGVTTFGDWGVVFARARPQWAWRLALGVLGLAAYLAALRALAFLYLRLAGASGFDSDALRRRALWPGVSAALVACAAEIAGGHPTLGSLGLALGCTLFVGWTLSRIGDFSPLATRCNNRALLIPFQPAWLTGGILLAGLFVGIVGRCLSNATAGHGLL